MPAKTLIKKTQILWLFSFYPRTSPNHRRPDCLPLIYYMLLTKFYHIILDMQCVCLPKMCGNMCVRAAIYVPGMNNRGIKSNNIDSTRSNAAGEEGKDETDCTGRTVRGAVVPQERVTEQPQL